VAVLLFLNGSEEGSHILWNWLPAKEITICKSILKRTGQEKEESESRCCISEK